MILNILFILNLFQNAYSFEYFGFIPELKANLKSNSSFDFKTNCFDINLSLNGTHLNFYSSNRQKFICGDTFLFGNHYRIDTKTILLEGNSTIKLENKTDVEQNDINYYGMNIFWFKNGFMESFANLYLTSKMFSGTPNEVEKNNLNFLKEKMNYEYKFWNKTVDFQEDEIKSGDYLAINRLDGLDPIIMWGTGSYIGHAAIALRINGELYICESTDKNPFGESYWPPPYGIIKTPYNKWIKQAKKANYLVSIIRLDDEHQKLFDTNIDKVVSHFNSLEGLPYGYNNFLFGWIDTLENNFPEPLTKELLSLSIAALDRGKNKDIVDKFIIEGLNKRINLNRLTYEPLKLNYSEIVEETIKRNTSIYDLYTIPENDDWVYSTGKSLVCDSLVLSLYKKAGIFDEIDNKLQATEFTPRDSYEIKIFNDNWKTKKCMNKGIFCQIMGKYQMELSDINSINMYKNMNEKCETKPPDYIRNKNC